MEIDTLHYIHRNHCITTIIAPPSFFSYLINRMQNRTFRKFVFDLYAVTTVYCNSVIGFLHFYRKRATIRAFYLFAVSRLNPRKRFRLYIHDPADRWWISLADRIAVFPERGGGEAGARVVGRFYR